MSDLLRMGKASSPPEPFMPANATDSHCHLFGPADRFPYAHDAPYTPADAGLECYRSLQASLGLSRAVFVQPVCHGDDHAALLDALARGAGAYRGVALLKPPLSLPQLLAFHEAGVRSVRYNFLPHLGGGLDFSACRAAADIIDKLGWHVTLHLTPAALIALEPQILNLPCPFVIDHFARIDASLGLDQDAFRILLRLMTRDSAWVKLSAADRASTAGPPYDDVVPFAHALIDSAPDRVLWGTDWPHPNVRTIPDDRDLIKLLGRFAPSATDRDRLLVRNPARLYGFGNAGVPSPAPLAA